MPSGTSIALFGLTIAVLTLSACSEKPPAPQPAAPVQAASRPQAHAPALRTVVARDGTGIYVSVEADPATVDGASLRSLRISTSDAKSTADAVAPPTPDTPWNVALRLGAPVDSIDAEGTLSDGRTFHVPCDTTLAPPVRNP